MHSLTLPDADIRGYYHQLGIPLPDRPGPELSVRCFADPGAHRREDRDPSCSVNLYNGAWQCHGCGARGGAYDAALALGHTPRSAIDLMITHGLIERRARLKTARELLTTSTETTYDRGQQPARPALEITEQDVHRWQTALARRPCLIAQLSDERGWHYNTMRNLGLGIDRGRITIPIRTGRNRLRGLLRYRPDPIHGPKMLAAPGTRLGLIPHPAADRTDHVVLVEGPPDMIAARSQGIPAIAVPGDHAWQRRWAHLITSSRVTVIMDSDEQGRTAALRIADDLAGPTRVEIVDLAPHRNDGYDLTDWLLDHPGASPIELVDLVAAKLSAIRKLNGGRAA
jgi:hypothetical protein